MSIDSLRSWAREYVRARELHAGAARTALVGMVAQAAAGTETVDANWVDEEAVSADDIKLTTLCELPDGSKRHRLRMPSSVALERAEKNLERELGALPVECDDPVVVAARALFADAEEPFYSCHIRPGGSPDPAEKARMDARVQRYTDVFINLKKAVRA